METITKKEIRNMLQYFSENSFKNPLFDTQKENDIWEIIEREFYDMGNSAEKHKNNWYDTKSIIKDLKNKYIHNIEFSLRCPAYGYRIFGDK